MADRVKGPAPRRRWLFALVCIIVAGMLSWMIVAMFLAGSKPRVETYTIRGLDYTTSFELEELQGFLYVYVPVNTDTEEAVFEVEDRRDNERVHEFFEQLDTFVPGEHELELADVTLRVIVDGIEE